MSFFRESLQECKVTGCFFGGPYNLSSHTREAEVSILHFKR